MIFPKAISCSAVISRKILIKFETEGNIAIKSDNYGTVVIRYYIKREPKHDDRLSKFDWHDLSPMFLTIMLLHNIKIS